MENFRKLGIIDPIVKALEEEKFEKPTEIQEKAIPYVTEGKDVIAESATGSGKTLVFAAGIIKECRKGSGLQALIMTPTRELAEQNMKALKIFSRYKPLNIISVYGGVSINPQIEGLKKADVAVGTPGRLLDHIKRRTIDLSKIKILVLDEADRMFDMGFIDDVKRIIRECPLKRQTLLFSATISHDVEFLAQKYMKTPIRISAESYVDPSKLKQTYYDISDHLKFSLLVHLLKQEHPGLVMVFCNTRNIVDFVTRNLQKQGIDAEAIHGGFTQAKRNQVLSQFHAKKLSVMVCTDVAARGLDIKGVSHVYNYNVPDEPKQYIHRIGRTARAGKEGKAITLLSKSEHPNFTKLLRETRFKIEKEITPPIEKINLPKRNKSIQKMGK